MTLNWFFDLNGKSEVSRGILDSELEMPKTDISSKDDLKVFIASRESKCGLCGLYAEIGAGRKPKLEKELRRFDEQWLLANASTLREHGINTALKKSFPALSRCAAMEPQAQTV